MRKLKHLWLVYAPMILWWPVHLVGQYTAKLLYRLGRRKPCELSMLATIDGQATVVLCRYDSGHPGACKYLEVHNE